MAELVGLAASILGIIQLTGQVAVLCRGYVSGVKRASHDMNQLMDELKLLGGVLAVLKDYIDKSSPAESSASAILATKDGPIAGCAVLLRTLEEKLTPRDGFKGMIDSLKWPLKEAETAQYVAQFERQKTIFTLAVGVDHITLTKKVEAYVMSTNLVVQDIWTESVDQKAWRQSEETQSRRRRRVEILNWISSAEFEKKTENKHIETSKGRHHPTGSWLLRTPQFLELTGETPRYPLLWGFGIPGAGKTFMSSVVIDHFLENGIAGECGVAYFYFEYQEQERQTPMKVLASLVRQLATQVTVLPAEIIALYDVQEAKGNNPKFEELYAVLVAVFKCFKEVFLVFDALDECDIKFRGKEVLPLLHRMGRSGARLFVTSRQYPEDIWESFHGTATMVELSPTLEDIGIYIQHRIDDDPRAKRLVRQAKCGERIISELAECSQGMFLLARFNVDYICQQTTARKVLIALDKIKNSLTTERPLDPTYDHAMQTLRGQSSDSVELGLRVLTWLVMTQRTLTVDEVLIAVAVEPGQYELDELDLPDKATISGVCAGLVVVDETSNTIKLAHYTVLEYLLENRIIPDDADLIIATTCITYLSFDVFAEGPCTSGVGLEARIRDHPFLEYAVLHLTYHLKACDQALTIQLIQDFIGNSAIISAYLQLWYQQGIQGRPLEHYDDYPKNRSTIHTAANMGNTVIVQTLIDQGADVGARDSGGWTALDGAACEGHVEVAALLIRNGASCLTQSFNGYTPLHQAIGGGSIEMVQLLLREGADHSVTADGGITALYVAVQAGREAIVELLLENGADSSTRESTGLTALHAAAIEGQVEIVKTLLKRGADISSRCNEGYSVLHAAVCNGQQAVVKLLLEKGADKATLNNLGESLLHSAAFGGYQELACLLLEHGADVSIIDMQGETIIHEAAWSGHDRLVQLLIANGADCSAAENTGFTVLHVAAMQGHVSMAAEILKHSVDISAVDSIGNTPLLWAASRGHLEFVQLLIDAGADISVQSVSGTTALDAAVSFGAQDVVRLLLQKGADVYVVDADGLTALHHAGNAAIAQMLLDSGADIAAADKCGKTALKTAAAAGNLEVVGVLQAALRKDGLLVLVKTELPEDRIDF